MKSLSENKQLFIYMFIAYIFSVSIRMIWVYQFSGTDAFMWNGQLMINTNDGYYFAEMARDILSGVLEVDAQLIATQGGVTAIVTAFFAKVLPFSFETVILYIPAFLGSLLVIPLVLIGYSLKQSHLGFIAALLGSIVWSYYNRTMTGYYDSDMLNIVLPMLVLWGLIHSILTQKDRYLILLVIFMILSQLWYPKNISLNSAMVFMSVIYLLIKYRENIFNFKLISFAFIGLATFSLTLKILLILSLFVLFHYKSELAKKYIYPIVGVSALVYLSSGAFNSILSSLNLYVVHRFFPSENIQDVAQLHFYGVIHTVREAGAISFETFANRISGHMLTFALSTIGVIILMIRNPILLISLPMVAMGFMAYKAGLRFTVYAVPIYALGFGYFVLFLMDYMKSFVSDKKNENIFKIVFLSLAMIAVLTPNINHILGYRVPTVLNNTEANDLEKLKKMASRDDYTLAWWDYGYPIRYYSDTNTLIDGGKHQNDNFIVSKLMFSTSPTQVANLSRLAIETYQDKNCSVVANTIFNTKENPKKLLNALKDPAYKTPKKRRDIYLYMPYNMMKIFPTVGVFSNLDLTTGNKERPIMFYSMRVAQQNRAKLMFSNGMTYDMSTGLLSLGRQSVKVHRFDTVEYQGFDKNAYQTQLKHIDGAYTLIYMKTYDTFAIMDRETYDSAFVQMFILGNYDKKLFELVVSSAYSKIYKLKK